MNEQWQTSTYSAGNGNCVRTRLRPDGNVDVGDSKDPDGPTLTFTRAEWDAFLAGLKEGQFDL
jgi:hypothetical protein